MIGEFLAWLHGLPQPALVAATGALVLAECTIGLGFVAPGESGLLVASTTVTTPTRFLVLWTVVVVCAALGDLIGYVLGRRLGPRLADSRVVRCYGAQHWEHATSLLRRHGSIAMFTGRYLPVLRTLVPAAAGASGLPLRGFLPAVVAGTTTWAAVHILIGATLGAAAKQVEQALGTGGAVVVGLLALVAVVTVARRRRAAVVDRAAARVGRHRR